MSVNEKMTAIADAIRSKTGKTGSLTLDSMAIEINNIEIEPTGLQAVSGTFTPSSNYGVGNNITISGLPFKPLCIFVSITSGFSSSDNKNYLLSFFFDSIGNNFVNLCSRKASSTVKSYIIGVNSSSINTEVTDDGFIASFNDTYYTNGYDYIWYAFG